MPARSASSGATMRHVSHSSLTTTTKPSGERRRRAIVRTIIAHPAPVNDDTRHAARVHIAFTSDLASSHTGWRVRCPEGVGEQHAGHVSWRAGDRLRAMATTSVATAATRRASRSTRRVRTRCCSTSAPDCATSGWRARATSRSAARACVSHLHWDHVQGLPFFGPLQHEAQRARRLRPGARRRPHGRRGARRRRSARRCSRSGSTASPAGSTSANRRPSSASAASTSRAAPCPTSARRSATA